MPIDEVIFDFHVISPDAPRPEDGVNCFGLFLEGARWDDSSHSLEESLPK